MLSYTSISALTLEFARCGRHGNRFEWDAEGKFIADETEKWGKVVMFSGAKVD